MSLDTRGLRHPPDFIIGGPPRSGTTSLWADMGRHPSICMASIKEPAFFVDEADGHWRAEVTGGPSFVGNLRRGTQWYRSLFRSCGEDKLRGEASTIYFYAPSAAQLIKTNVPTVRMIFVLRDPLDRIVSHYWHDRRSAPLPPLKEMFEESHPQFGLYLRVSSYATNLERYWSQFDRSQLMVLLFDELTDNPTKALNAAAAFVGADPSAQPVEQLSKRNSSGVFRSELLHRLIVRNYPGPARLKHWGRLAKNRLSDWNLKPLPYAELETDTARHILDLLLPEIERTERILGKDLSSWKREPMETP